MIATDLSKQQAPGADTKVIQLINFTGNLSRVESATMFYYWRGKRNRFRLFTRNCKSILILFFALI